MKTETITQVGLAVAIPLASAAIALLWNLNGNVIAIAAKIDSLTDSNKMQQQTIAEHETRIRSLEIKRP